MAVILFFKKMFYPYNNMYCCFSMKHSIKGVGVMCPGEVICLPVTCLPVTCLPVDCYILVSLL